MRTYVSMVARIITIGDTEFFRRGHGDFTQIKLRVPSKVNCYQRGETRKGSMSNSE